MRIAIVSRELLDSNCIAHLNGRIASPEHAFDNGPCQNWHHPAYYPNLYVAVLVETQVPVGILYAGGPESKIDAAWWIDASFRGRHFGSEIIDEFALLLKSKGVTGVGQILVDTFGGKYQEASSCLRARLQSHFS